MKRRLALNYECLGERTAQAYVTLPDGDDLRDKETRERWVKNLADQLAIFLALNDHHARGHPAQYQNQQDAQQRAQDGPQGGDSPEVPSPGWWEHWCGLASRS